MQPEREGIRVSTLDNANSSLQLIQKTESELDWIRLCNEISSKFKTFMWQNLFCFDAMRAIHGYKK